MKSVTNLNARPRRWYRIELQAKTHDAATKLGQLITQIDSDAIFSEFELMTAGLPQWSVETYRAKLSVIESLHKKAATIFANPPLDYHRKSLTIVEHIDIKSLYLAECRSAERIIGMINELKCTISDDIDIRKPENQLLRWRELHRRVELIEDTLNECSKSTDAARLKKRHNALRKEMLKIEQLLDDGNTVSERLDVVEKDIEAVTPLYVSLKVKAVTGSSRGSLWRLSAPPYRGIGR